MRYLAALSLLAVLGGCGKASVQSGAGGLGVSRDLVIGAPEASVLQAVTNLCAGLHTKDQNFRALYAGRNDLTFKFTAKHRACGGNLATVTPAPSAHVAVSGGVLNYVVTGQFLPGTDVMTDTVGITSQLCGALQASRLTSPVEVSSTVALWYSFPSPGQCGTSVSGTNKVCLHLETGFKQETGSYSVTSSENLLFDFTQGAADYGMLIWHQRFDSSVCDGSDYEETTTSFVEIQN